MVIRKLYEAPGSPTMSAAPTSVEAPARVIVEVSQGTLSGLKESLPNGRDLFSFRGIPYAKPPIGELRFKAPVELEKFSEAVLDCSKERNTCIGKDVVTHIISGEEDGLFLNVYTPKIPKDDAKLLPVMVYIHGGGFIMGSGDSVMYYPDYLVQEDVVVVTLNYRLGPLGFLCLPSVGIDGNAGLKDQLLAFKWVKKNIAKFNGDPKNVTLFGESAGSACVHFHYTSSVSRQYFHKAIAQSGVAFGTWVFQVDPEKKARKLAKLVGCTGDSDENVLKTLMAASAKDLVFHQTGTMEEAEKVLELEIPFRPVIENKDAVGAIVTKSPIEVLKTTNSIDLPLMLGVTSNEGLITLNEGIKRIDVYEKELHRLLPSNVNVAIGSEEATKLGEQVRKFYFGDKPIDKNAFNELSNVMSDNNFNIPVQIAAELSAKYQHKSKLFFYHFAFSGELNNIKKMLNFSDYPGASHADDIYYLFSNSAQKADVEKGSKEDTVRNAMVTLWTNFAKFGNPTPDDDHSLAFKWQPVTPSDPASAEFELDYLNIDSKIEMLKNLNKERVALWKKIYAKYNGGFLSPKLC